jgi:hypothetical protein
MALFMIVPAIIYKQYFLALAFIIFGLVFGFMEFLANYYTGKTVSQHLWILQDVKAYKAYIVVAGMYLGWMFLLTHLLVRFKGN